MNQKISKELAGEIERLQQVIASPNSRRSPDTPKSPNPNPGLRPRPAATMVLIEGEGENAKILMGKRNKSLRFMPGALVFPGGSVDRYDGSVPLCEEMAEATQNQLLAHMGNRASKRAARALGLAAIRETAEESGLLIGEKRDFTMPKLAHEDWAFFDQHHVTPSLKGVTLLSRAITPPGQPRRFDTWFFIARSSCVAHVPESGFDPCGELEDLQWISPIDAIAENTREITRVMLVEIMQRLKEDPELTFGYPAPKYYFRNGQFNRVVMG